MAFHHHKKINKLELPSREKIVLHTLADYADQQGKCWPSIETIGRGASMSRSSVIRAIKVLADKGLLRKTLTQHSNHYVVTLPEVHFDTPVVSEWNFQSVNVTPEYTNEQNNDNIKKSFANAKAEEINSTEENQQETPSVNTIDIVKESTCATVLKNGKKISPTDLEILWKTILPQKYPDIKHVKPFTVAQLGMMKHFTKAVSPHSAFNILEEVLNYWSEFGSYIYSNTDVKAIPVRPNVQFILKYSQEASNFHLVYKPQQKENEEKAKQHKLLIAQELAANAAKLAKKFQDEYEPPITLEEIEALEKEMGS